MSIVIIYLLFGVSHWISHVLSCNNCKDNLLSVVAFFTHGIVQTLGWPVYAAEYLLEMFRKKEPFELSDEEKALIEFHRMRRQMPNLMPNIIKSMTDLPADMPEELKRAIGHLMKAKEEMEKKDGPN